MNFEDIQKAWQSQPTQNDLRVPAELLSAEMKRNARSFVREIFWRDLREVGGSLIMIPIFFYIGSRHDLPWTWYLIVPALAWIAFFMTLDRFRHQGLPEPEAPLQMHLAIGLAQVEHQIRLLRKILWWYILPLGIAVIPFFAQVLWQARGAGWLIALIALGLVVFELSLSAGIYWTNQKAIQWDLEPRRLELLRLKSTLAENGMEFDELAKRYKKPVTRGMLAWMVLITLATAGLSVAADRAGASNARGPVRQPSFITSAGHPEVAKLLVNAVQKHNVPAMAAALVTSEGLKWEAAAGTRKVGSNIPATLQDKWHLGSNGKAMTAVLMASLVEKGLLQWGTTLEQVFPELAPGMDSEARKITITELLSHRSGLPANPSLLRYRGADGKAERARLVKTELAKPLTHKRGSHYEYSNLGYAIAGAVAERITGQTWEVAMQRHVFDPLHMTTVGFGGTGTPGQLDQPWGHTAKGKAVGSNGPTQDNPPVLSPAGRIHCTIQDWAKFIADQLRGARGEKALLKPESYAKLHTAISGQDYALGWGVADRPWGGGTVLHHAGDNTMNFANVWVAPKRNFAVLVCVNQSGDVAFQASDEVVGGVIALH